MFKSFCQSSLSLKSKLLIAITFAVSFALFVVSVLLIANNACNEWTKINERLIIQVHIIADNCIPAVIFDDPEAAQEILAAIKADNTVSYAHITVDKNRIFAEYKSLLQNTNFILDIADNLSLPTKIELNQAVFYQGKKIATIYMAASLSALYVNNLQYSLIAFLISLFSMALAVMLANYLVHSAIKPILQLSKMAQRISRWGDYSLRTEIYSQDEVGQLSCSFNEMLDEIERKDSILEQTVAERTSELIQLNKQLQHQAQHDPLTGLANRKLYEDRLQVVYIQAQRSQRKFGLMYFDLDHFKMINDTLGHDTGDEVLIQVAQRINGIIRDEDILCRMGGDEFTLILSDIHKQEDMQLVAEKMLEAFAQPFFCHQHELTISSSMGLAIYPNDTKSKTQLMSYADLAMYHAKQSGRNNYCFFTESMRKQNEVSLEYRVKLKTLLKTAVDNREIQIVYQPQVDMQRKIVGMEALLRWKNAENGIIPPEVFIPIAEETGLIQGLEEWAFSEICADYVQWRLQGIPVLKVSVNISGHRLRQKDFLKFIVETLEALGLPTSFLIFEVHETEIMQNLTEIKTIFEQLHQQGIKIAVDNFGSGYTSLNYLQQLAVDEFKIDAQFVRQLDHPYESNSVVQAIVGLAHSLKKLVTAMGVENEMQLNHLRVLNCTTMQGYLFAKPMSAKEVSALLSRTLYLIPED